MFTLQTRLWIWRGKTLKTYVSITSKNSSSRKGRGGYIAVGVNRLCMMVHCALLLRVSTQKPAPIPSNGKSKNDLLCFSLQFLCIDLWHNFIICTYMYSTAFTPFLPKFCPDELSSLSRSLCLCMGPGGKKGWWWGGGGETGKCQLSPDISGESQQQTLIIH